MASAPDGARLKVLPLWFKSPKTQVGRFRRSSNLTLTRHSSCQLATASAANRSFVISVMVSTCLRLRRKRIPPSNKISLSACQAVFQIRGQFVSESRHSSRIGDKPAWSAGECRCGKAFPHKRLPGVLSLGSHAPRSPGSIASRPCLGPGIVSVPS
jgi:hypothetical protein